MTICVTRDQIFFAFSPDLQPAKRIRQNEEIILETHDCFEGQIQTSSDLVDKLDWNHVNPATGPLYIEGAKFYSEDVKTHYDIPHEFTFLYTEKEDFFVIAFFGVEYSLNVGEPQIDSYLEWLTKNESRSPLYLDGVSYELSQDNFVGLKEGAIIEICVRE